MASTAASSPTRPDTIINGRSGPFFPKNLQSCQAAEARHEIVGQHYVPRALFESGAHLLRSVHPPMGDLVAGPPQSLDHEHGIVGRILNEKEAERASGSAVLIRLFH